MMDRMAYGVGSDGLMLNFLPFSESYLKVATWLPQFRLMRGLWRVKSFLAAHGPWRSPQGPEVNVSNRKYEHQPCPP